jgi:hypothetical protein
LSSSDLRTSRAPLDRTQRAGACSPGPEAAGSIEPLAVDGASAKGRTLLTFGGPRDVLARIVDGDPLGLRPRIAARVRARCLLLDADRAHLRTLALCARFAPRYRGRPGLDEWLMGLVDRALEEGVAEEAERLEGPPPARPETGGAFAQLGKPLGLAPEEVRRACARFNLLPLESREAFFDLVLERGDLDDLARRAALGATELARRARRALQALLGVEVGTGTRGAEVSATGAAGAATLGSGTADPMTLGSGTADPMTLGSGAAGAVTIRPEASGLVTIRPGASGLVPSGQDGDLRRARSADPCGEGSGESAL